LVNFRIHIKSATQVLLPFFFVGRCNLFIKLMSNYLHSAVFEYFLTLNCSESLKQTLTVVLSNTIAHGSVNQYLLTLQEPFCTIWSIIKCKAFCQYPVYIALEYCRETGPPQWIDN